MVESVGDVECELAVDASACVAFLHGTIYVDQQVAAEAAVFAGDGIIAKADDIGGAVFPEILPIGPGDAFVIDKYD